MARLGRDSGGAGVLQWLLMIAVFLLGVAGSVRALGSSLSASYGKLSPNVVLVNGADPPEAASSLRPPSISKEVGYSLDAFARDRVALMQNPAALEELDRFARGGGGDYNVLRGMDGKFEDGITGIPRFHSFVRNYYEGKKITVPFKPLFEKDGWLAVLNDKSPMPDLENEPHVAAMSAVHFSMIPKKPIYNIASATMDDLDSIHHAQSIARQEFDANKKEILARVSAGVETKLRAENDAVKRARIQQEWAQLLASAESASGKDLEFYFHVHQADGGGHSIGYLHMHAILGNARTNASHDSKSLRADIPALRKVFEGQNAASRIQNPATTAGTPGSLISAFTALHEKIEGIHELSRERKDELHGALVELERDFANYAGGEGTTVYVMEGATGVSEEAGRPSTDSDENMALKPVAFVTQQINQPAVVAVPDSANAEHTYDFLKGLGARVEFLETGKALEPGVIYVANMQNADHMKESAATAREVMVLGPPLGHAHMLLEHKPHVTIMGSANKALDPRSLSTNTKDPESIPFLRAAMKGNVTTIPSKSMGAASAIPLAELALGTSLITPEDMKHWALNGEEQFLGAVEPGHYLLDKRLVQGGARSLYMSKIDPATGEEHWPTDLDPRGTGLAFLTLLKQVEHAKLRPENLAAAVTKVSPGYEYLGKSDGGSVAKQNLLKLVGAYRNYPGLKAVPGYEESRLIIERMDDQHAIHAFTAVVLAFHDIYHEKTTNGWQNSLTPGQQWQAKNFVDSYVKNPGKQVPYDAIAVMSPFIGIPKTDKERRMVANKIELVLWMDLLIRGMTSGVTSGGAKGLNAAGLWRSRPLVAPVRMGTGGQR